MTKNGRMYKLDHCTYVCQYHLVWATKYRGKALANKYIKQELKRNFRLICNWKHFRILAWHIGDEHIHLYLIISPKYSVSYAVSLIKAKSSAWIKKKNKKIPQGSFWCRGYFVSTAGVNEIALRTYIRDQDRYRTEKLKLSLW